MIRNLLTLLVLLSASHALAAPSYSPGGVISGGNGERVERLRMTSGGSVTSQTGAWISSITNNAAAGDWTLNIASGVFSVIPTCMCTVEEGNGRICETSTATALSTTLIRLETFTDSGAAIDAALGVVCVGTR